MSLWVRDSQGFKLADTGDILSEVQNVFKSIWTDLNLDPATPQGQLITYLTNQLTDIQSELVYFANIWTFGGEGMYLDTWAQSLYGITRKPAVNTTVDVIFYGTPNTIIAAGFQASDGTNPCTLQEDIVIGKNGQILGSLTCNISGPISYVANSVTQILTPVIGLERINNPNAGNTGVEEETDQELYNRAKESVLYEAQSVFSAGLARIANIEGVTKVGGYENISNLPVMWKGTEIKPNSVNYIVKGGAATDIASVLLACKNPGCAMGGDVLVQVLDKISQQYYQMRFYRPIETPIYFQVTVQPSLDDDKNYPERIIAAIIDNLNLLTFGATIYPVDMVSQLGEVGTKIIDFKVGRTASVASYDAINLNFLEEAITNANNINILIAANTEPLI